LDGQTIWNEIHLPDPGKEDLKSYSVVKGVPELGLAILGGSNGNMYLYRDSSAIEKITQVKGKVADIFPFSNSKTNLVFLVTTLGTGTATIFTFDLSYPTSSTNPTSITFNIPHKFIVTSAGYSRGSLVLGSRNGSLAVVSLTPHEAPVTVWNPDDSERGDAITSIAFFPAYKDMDKIYFLTTGRNGKYSIFASTPLSDGHASANTHVMAVHHCTPPLGPNIEHAWFDGSNLLLYGFRSKNFIVWNETKQCEIMNVECGGAHRSYAYSHLEDGGGYFIYTKASKLYLHAQNKPSHRIMRPGGHGREIKASAVSPDKNLIATGAEDTAIRIWRYRDSASPLKNKLESLAVTRKHSTGIQSLQFHGSEYLFSSGGNEEFFVWALHSIPVFGIGIVCEAGCPDQSREKDLRVVSFDVSSLPSAAKESDSTELLISLAFSDSTMRTYRYSKPTRFTLLAKGRYTSSCLMHIRHVRVTQSEVYLLTAATDGNLIMWKMDISPPFTMQNMKLVKLSTHKLHQSSIKCLDLQSSSSGENIVVATGGDDNALGITLYSTDTLPTPPKSIILPSAHAAAVTGLSFSLAPLRDANMEEFRIVSSSNDQRVKEWVVKVYGQGKMELRKVGDIFTSVADVGDVVDIADGASSIGEPGMRKNKVLVAGNGMEVFGVSIEA
jgi:WD40 repeat protein